jgi:RNA polymerase sigma factor (sigma-70 family)
VRNILYDGYLGPRMTRNMQKLRVKNVLEHELTEDQRRAVVGYYLEEKTIIELAAEFGVNKSTVWRTLKRAEARMRRCLRY